MGTYECSNSLNGLSRRVVMPFEWRTVNQNIAGEENDEG